MNCPKCDKTIRGVIVNHAPTTPGDFQNTIRCVAYCCPECLCILSVESDPVIRDAGAQKLQKEFEAVKSQIDVTLRKLSAKSMTA